MKPPAVSLAPEIDAVLALPYPLLTAADIAAAVGFEENFIREQMAAGRIAHKVLGGQRTNAKGHGGKDYNKPAAQVRPHVRRLASKAAVLSWLWSSHRGDKTLMRERLREVWPELLALLESARPDFALEALAPPSAEARKKIVPHPAMAARAANVAHLQPAVKHPELRFFA